MTEKPIHVLFVCLGNICRSPTAHGVFQHLVNEHLLGDHITVDSAGTASWHIGKEPDSRTTHTAARRGYNLSVLRARQVTSEDFQLFDYILAMDQSNLEDLYELKPADFCGELGLFLDYADSSIRSREVPDPYYGGDDGFERVLDMVENASNGLLQHMIKQYGL